LTSSDNKNTIHKDCKNPIPSDNITFAQLLGFMKRQRLVYNTFRLPKFNTLSNKKQKKNLNIANLTPEKIALKGKILKKTICFKYGKMKNRTYSK